MELLLDAFIASAWDTGQLYALTILHLRKRALYPSQIPPTFLQSFTHIFK